MSVPIEYPIAASPVQADVHNLEPEHHDKNYVVAGRHTYELDDEQFQKICTINFGSGAVSTGDWVAAQPMTINGDRLI